MSDYRVFFLPVLLASVFAGSAAAMDLTVSAPNSQTHIYTHIHTPIPEPAPLFAELEKSYQTAGVCFLGFGGCGDDGRFSSGSSSSGSGTTGDDDFTIDTVAQCKNEGFTITSCSAGSAASGACPYDDRYFNSCVSYDELCKQNNYYKSCSGNLVLDPSQSCDYDSSYQKCVSAEEKCEEEGYFNHCEDGKILDPGQVCSYSSSYQKCECNPCDGYDYTYEQATEQGYEPDGDACNSCGTKKYKRKAKECLGFSVCDCGGEIGATECWSGQQQMFLSCKECVEECSSGEIDLNNYWCNGALKCFFK